MTTKYTSKYWSNVAREIVPYVAGEQPKDRKYIKLNTNESPYPPSPKVIAAIKEAADDSLRLYPNPDGDELKEAIAERYGLEKGQVFVGNGSDELLAFAFRAFFNPGEPILFPDITYSFYPVYAGVFELGYNLLPLNDDFTVPVEKYFVPNGGAIVCNPNAPTGELLPLDAIRRILEHNREKVVIVDEAYIDFGGKSAAPLIKEFPNLLVVQTFSKSRALAGLRVAFAMGSRELMDGLCRVKESINSYTVDRLAQKGAVAAIKDEENFREITTKVIATRERVAGELAKLGFVALPSCANFVFITHPQVKAQVLFAKLREKGILVRYFNSPRIDNFLRVSIGSDAEMDAFLAVVKDILQAR